MVPMLRRALWQRPEPGRRARSVVMISTITAAGAGPPRAKYACFGVARAGGPAGFGNKREDMARL